MYFPTRPIFIYGTPIPSVLRKPGNSQYPLLEQLLIMNETLSARRTLSSLPKERQNSNRKTQKWGKKVTFWKMQMNDETSSTAFYKE